MDDGTQVKVQTFSVGFTVPIHPRIGDRTALEDEQESESTTKQEADDEERVRSLTEWARWE